MAGFESGARFPFINLEKAIARARELYDADQRGNEMPISGAFAVWKYSEKSSGGFQTVAALKMYGLLEDAGSKEARKVKLTKHALDYFRDEREEMRAGKLKAFATNPGLFAILFNKHWGAEVPNDAVARSQLKVDGELNEQSARAALGIYKENMAFAKLKGDGIIQELQQNADEATSRNDLLPPPKIGDYVQWTSNGVDQFKPPRKVTNIIGRHAFVHGSNTGIDMSELTVTTAPAPTPIGATKAPATPAPANADENPISVLLASNRLQITADVDYNGLEKLELMLAKYKEILKMLQ
jgi:hypothetical protein